MWVGVVPQQPPIMRCAGVHGHRHVGGHPPRRQVVPVSVEALSPTT
jgi:hypothetical protein